MKNKNTIILVNLLTFIRIVGTFIIPFIINELSAKQLIIYIALSLLTDSFDGILARKYNACTLFGAMLDTLADKMFGIATLLIILSNNSVMILPIFTEVLIMVINTAGVIKGAAVESSYLGKIKTWILGICTILAFLIVYSNQLLNILNPNTPFGLLTSNILMLLIKSDTITLTNLAFTMVGADLMVAFDYISRNLESSKKAKDKGIKVKNFQLKKGKELKEALFSQEYYFKTKNQPYIVRLGKEVKNERKNKK